MLVLATVIGSIACAELRSHLWYAGADDLEAERTRARQCLGLEASHPAWAGAGAVRLASLATLERNWEEAIDLATTAIALASRARDVELEIVAADELGNALFAAGRLEEARAAFQRAFDLADPAVWSSWRAVVAKDLGITHTNTGAPELSVALLEEAKELRPWWPSPELEVAIEGNLGSAWLRLGAPDLADAAYTRALQASRALADPAALMDSLLRLSSLRLELEDPDGALPLLEEAVGLVETGAIREEDQEWLLGLYGDALYRTGRAGSSVAVLRRRLEIARSFPQGSHRAGTAQVDLAVTLLQVDADNPVARAEASDLLDQVAALPHKGPGLEVALLRGRAYAAAADGSDPDTIRAASLDALDALDRFVDHRASPADRRRFSGQSADVRELLLSVLAEGNDPAALFAVLERGRAELLRAELARAGLPISSGDSRVATLRQRLLTLAPADPRRRETEIELDALQELERDREVRGQLLDAVPTTSLAAVQASLPAGTAILAYDLVPSGRVLATAVTATEFRRRWLSTPARQLQTRISAASQLGNSSRADPILNQLAQEVLLPLGVGVDLPLPEHLVVVPTAFLYDLPWDLLPLDGKRMGATHTFQLAPSVSVWLALDARARSLDSRPALILGVTGNTNTGPAGARTGVGWAGIDAEGLDLRPIPNVRREVSRITRTLGGSVETWLDHQAGEGRLKGMDLRAFDLLHVATHGLASSAAPSRSALWLAADGDEDGLLQAREIALLPLAARLVVLSACRTSQAAPSLGVEGLARAFLAAGATAVIAAHQDVDDRATAELMHELYRGLARGLEPARALQQAKRAAERRGLPRRSWSAFVLIGAGIQPLRPPPPPPRLAWPAIVALGLVALGVVVVRRRNP
jgi:CHAT domain-containing protein/tetratricopeptide (TPR) repeat protein